MKQATLLLGIALLFAGSAAAQANSPEPQSLATAASQNSLPALLPDAPLKLALPPVAIEAPASAPSSFGLALPAAPTPAEPAEPQVVQGVFQNFYWQAYVGFTYLRFFEVPGVQVNTEGVNFGVVYYFKDWLGADGEFVGTFAPAPGCLAKYLMGMGGIRVRHSMQHNIEVWAHGLIGAATFRPQTAYGNQTSYGYEVGGGVDLNTHHRRLAYRVSLDAAGTTYFNTYQVSPKVSAGVVFKF
jgi:hypothetical protein